MQALLKDQAVAVETRAWESEGMQEVREARWQAALDALLAAIPTTDRADPRKSAPWKVRVAVRLKDTTDVTNGWLADRLDMGSGFYVSKHVGLVRKVKGSIGLP